MINPSTYGWIEKFFNKNEHHFIDFSGNYTRFYNEIRNSGFIYGYTVSIPLEESINIEGLSQDEITKIALLNALYSVFRIVKKNTDSTVFISEAKKFYKTIQRENYNFLKTIFPSESDLSKLETIIDNRIQTNSNFFSKNFSHIITNALLFIDVLAFHYFLINGELSNKYLKDFENNCISIVSLAFQVKERKSKYDELLIKLFENSLRYTKFQKNETFDLAQISLEATHFTIETFYLLDLAQMALWSDEKLEPSEQSFLYKIAEKLEISSNDLLESSVAIANFITTYKEDIPYFNYSNPVKHFYDQTNKTVSKLVGRNKKRLIKEISQSKELMVLLTQSTTRELNENEKKKVKKQLLDICKTIPSLTIFLLPGGGILLPILIKYIPQLLPSAFNENLEDE
jgi:hypothetical protein